VTLRSPVFIRAVLAAFTSIPTSDPIRTKVKFFTTDGTRQRPPSNGLDTGRSVKVITAVFNPFLFVLTTDLTATPALRVLFA
jgi:hypothetical protein